MWLLSDDRSAVNGVINEVTMTSRKDIDEEDGKSVLKDGDEVKVIIAPIDRRMYDYLIAIQSDSNGPSMFFRRTIASGISLHQLKLRHRLYSVRI